MKIIRGQRDSLGVPIEPDTKLPIMSDWQGEAIYEGDEYYQTDFGKVLAIDESVKEFTDEILGQKLVAESGGYHE